MTPATDVLVVGGGIAGLTTALAAAARGLSVRILDTPRSGSASRAAAGMLAPSLEGLPGGVREAALEARDTYPEFLAALCARTGRTVPLDRNGILELATSGDELSRFSSRAGAGAESFEGAALARLEPAFAGHAGAVLHPGDGCVDNVALMDALEAAVTLEARISRVEERATGLDRDGAVIAVLTEARSRFEAAHVVLASGAWVATLGGLPHPIPVHPVRGQLLTLAARPISHVTYGGGGYLVPRGDRLLIGATSEDTGFELGTTDAGLSHLRTVAARAVPSLRDAPVLEHWAGFRPMTPDTMPILGADSRDPRLFYAGGFSRNGILFAPWAAAHLAGLLAGERASEPLGLFSIARFGWK